MNLETSIVLFITLTLIGHLEAANPQANEIDGSRQAGPIEPIQSKVLQPLVNVDKSNGKSQVDVHVPVVFNMNSQSDNVTGKSQLDLSVLGGLVTVTSDRQRDMSGNLSGPLTVTVFGIPVYTGIRRDGKIISTSAIGDNITKPANIQTDATRTLQTIQSNVQATGQAAANQIRQLNQRTLESLNNLLNRLIDRFDRPKSLNGTSQASP